MDVDYSLAPVDYLMVLAYGAAVLWIGVRLGRKHSSEEDYFLAGRRMRWPFVGVSLFASNISSTTLVGLAGAAYLSGIAVFNYEWMAALVLVFFAVFILPFLLRARVYTIPEFLERRYSRRLRRYFSGLTLFLNIVVDTAGSLFAGSLLLKLVFPQLDMAVTVALLALVAGLYTILGGLAAVIYTDFIQTVLLLVGAVVITLAALTEVGGWSGMTAGLDPGHLSLIRPLDDPDMPWLGLLTGVPLLGFYFWCANQFMVQRALSARSLDHGRWGVLLAAFLKLPVLFLMVLPGVMAIHLYPGLTDANLVYPTLIFDLLPTGLLGLVMAGFVAALMSQIDSTLNAASTLVTMDFIRPWKPHLDSRQLLRVGRWCTALFMVLAAAWAPMIENFRSLFNYLQTVLSYTVSPVVAVYLLGFFSTRPNARGASASVTVTTVCGVALFFAVEVFALFDLHFLYAGPILFALAAAILFTASRPSGAPDDRQRQLVWTPAFFREESEALARQPWWRNYRWLSVGLLCLTGALVACFA